MAAVRELSRAEARRIMVRAQLLDEPSPTDVVDVVRRLTMLQIDQTSAVAPSADLVLWSRIGSSYDPAELTALLEDRTLLELRGRIHPAEDLALHRADMAQWLAGPDLLEWQEHLRDWVAANDECRRDILALLRVEGPLTTTQLPDTTAVPWRSSGWTHGKNVARLLDLMVQRGEVAVAGREGRERLWDLASRIYPDDPVPPPAEAWRLRNQRRLRALGVAKVPPPQSPVEPADVGEIGVPATIEGVRGRWRADPDLLERLAEPLSPRTALLSPLDRLVFDRKRMADVFEFDYQLEMYKPPAKRRWGYYALPILHGDRLVGKVDATADHDAGLLRLDAVHEDEPFGPEVAAAVRAEIDDLAAWLRLELAVG